MAANTANDLQEDSVADIKKTVCCLLAWLIFCCLQCLGLGQRQVISQETVISVKQ